MSISIGGWKVFARLLLRGFFPLLLFGSTWLCQYLISTGLSPSLVVFGSIFASTVLILGVQKLAPFSPDYVGTPKEFGIDFIHMLSTGLTAEMVKAATFGGLMVGAVYLSGLWGEMIWPSDWHWSLQLGLALLVGDFGAYWFHRLAHRTPLFWRIHAMHHTSEKMYVLASARNHPFNVVFSYSSQVVPLVLLGAPMEPLALLSVFTGVHGMLQHSNIDLHYGIWNWVFATADLHRWHHSADFDESNTNFGSNLILWDIVFRTRYLPEDRKKPVAAGLGPDMEIPTTWWAHITSPFLLRQYQTVPVPVEVPDRPTERTSAGS